MKQIQTNWPLRPTAPFKEGDGIVRLRASSFPYKLRDGVTYLGLTSTGTMTLYLPPSGLVCVVDAEGSAVSNNITVYPPNGFSLMDGSVNEPFAIDIAWASFMFVLRPNSKIWSVS